MISITFECINDDDGVTHRSHLLLETVLSDDIEPACAKHKLSAFYDACRIFNTTVNEKSGSDK